MRRSKGTAIVERWWRIEEVVHFFRRRKKAAVEGGGKWNRGNISTSLDVVDGTLLFLIILPDNDFFMVPYLVYKYWDIVVNFMIISTYSKMAIYLFENSYTIVQSLSTPNSCDLNPGRETCRVSFFRCMAE